jgi:hypothetical protein
MAMTRNNSNVLDIERATDQTTGSGTLTEDALDSVDWDYSYDEFVLLQEEQHPVTYGDYMDDYYNERELASEEYSEVYSNVF